MNISGFCTQWQYFPVNFLTFNFSIVSYSNALKCYSRARDYCTTAKHVINMCVNVIKVGPATYFFTFNISPSSMLLIRVCAHHGSIPVSWSIQQKKHGIWITKNWFFPQECQSNKYSDWMIILLRTTILGKYMYLTRPWRDLFSYVQKCLLFFFDLKFIQSI